jgi:glucose/arabinose dehydrogenase
MDASPRRPRTHALLAAALVATLAAGADGQTRLATRRVAQGLTAPLYATSPPGDRERLYVVEQPGRIRVVEDGVLLPAPFLNLPNATSTGGGQGVLGLAFHPDHAANGLFYVYYTGPVAGGGRADSILARFQALSPYAADPASETVLLTQAQPYPNHNSGNLQFGPDGHLYVGMGDGGSQGDPGCRAQDGSTWLGKILRLDVDAPGPYGIPADNPFVGDPAVRDEIWALGLRHPWRFSFDLQTGDLWIADVGQDALEEVDFAPTGGPGGANFGWRVMESTACHDDTGCVPAPPPCGDPALALPVHEYPHTEGRCAIVGGYVYRGCAIPDLFGTYFYADYCTARIWSFRYDGAAVTDLQERTAELGVSVGGHSVDLITSFGQDAHGELYLCDQGGEVFVIEPAGPVPTAYCTGKTSSLGCVPFVCSTGTPSVTATGAFSVLARQVVPGEAGFAIYGFAKANLSFHGGRLCVKVPFRRLLPAKLALPLDPPPCTGVMKRNFNNLIQSGSDPLLTAGQTVHVQWRQRDGLDPSLFGDNLTDGLAFVIQP